VWSHDGFICVGEVYKNYLKMIFPKGASFGDIRACMLNLLIFNVLRLSCIGVRTISPDSGPRWPIPPFRLHAHVDYARVADDSFRMQNDEYEQTV
jgi:hypothetical protein